MLGEDQINTLCTVMEKYIRPKPDGQDDEINLDLMTADEQWRTFKMVDEMVEKIQQESKEAERLFTGPANALEGEVEGGSHENEVIDDDRSQKIEEQGQQIEEEEQNQKMGEQSEQNRGIGNDSMLEYAVDVQTLL